MEKNDSEKKAGVKIQVVLVGEPAEKFLEACRCNHRTMAGEAAFRLEKSLKADAAIDLN